MANDKQNNETEKQNIETETVEVSVDEKKKGIIKCPKCGEEFPDTIACCMICGAQLKKKQYEPISEKKAKTIRWVVGGVLIVAFVIWYAIFFL